MKKTRALYYFAALLSLLPFLLNAAEAPISVDGAKTINATKAKQLFDDGVLFIDPRRDSDFSAGRIPDAIPLELKAVFNQESLASEAKKSDAIVFYCNGPQCDRSAVCAEKAISWGYSDVYYFRDGFPAWKLAGYPVE